MNWNRGHSPPFQGGVAATPRSGRGGCVSDKNHPGCASQGTGPFLGGAQPPLLGKEGNALDSNSFTGPTVPKSDYRQIRVIALGLTRHQGRDNLGQANKRKFLELLFMVTRTPSGKRADNCFAATSMPSVESAGVSKTATNSL